MNTTEECASQYRGISHIMVQAGFTVATCDCSVHIKSGNIAWDRACNRACKLAIELVPCTSSARAAEVVKNFKSHLCLLQVSVTQGKTNVYTKVFFFSKYKNFSSARLPTFGKCSYSSDAVCGFLHPGLSRHLCNQLPVVSEIGLQWPWGSPLKQQKNHH